MFLVRCIRTLYSLNLERIGWRQDLTTIPDARRDGVRRSCTFVASSPR